MSGIAGILLILYGAITAYLGYSEKMSRVHLLTPFAIDVTIALGIVLILLGIAHFKAPHKAYLATIPALIYFHTQMYFNAIFYFARPMWPQQMSLVGISIGILGLSYLGFSARVVEIASDSDTNR
jgi:hypothetical protein